MDRALSLLVDRELIIRPKQGWYRFIDPVFQYWVNHHLNGKLIRAPEGKDHIRSLWEPPA